MIVGRLPLYNLPDGHWAHDFLQIQTQLWIDVRERRCNSEKVLIFAACILRKKKSIKFMTNIKPLIYKWLECWKAGQYYALVKEVEDTAI